MTTSARWLLSAPEHRIASTAETIDRIVPVQFGDDFIAADVVIPASGSDESGCKWTKTLVGGGTVGALADTVNGIMACALTATNEAQDATLHMDDQLCFSLKQGLVFEARINLPVLPSGAGVIACWGLASAYNAVADTVATNCWFRAEADGAILWETDDGDTDDDDNATGVTVLVTDWKVYRIQVVQTAANTATAYFYINGTLVGTASFTALSDAEALVQPYITIQKTATTRVGTVYVDYVRVWMDRADSY